MGKQKISFRKNKVIEPPKKKLNDIYDELNVEEALLDVDEKEDPLVSEYEEDEN